MQLLENDVILPVQYLPPARNYFAEREKSLMFELLIDAVRCFQIRPACKSKRSQRFEEAERWFLSDDYEWPFSFVNVCEALGIEPKRFRRKLVESRNMGTRDMPSSVKIPTRNATRR